jgi:hypothetical protein
VLVAGNGRNKLLESFSKEKIKIAS